MSVFQIISIVLALSAVFIKSAFTAVVLFVALISVIVGIGIYNGHVIQSVIVFISYMTVNVILVGIFYWNER